MELDCGIRKERIDTWLDDELRLERGCGDAWVFRFEKAECQVETAALESRPLGTIELERTKVVVDGDDAAVDEFMRLFTLRFVSAGG